MRRLHVTRLLATTRALLILCACGRPGLGWADPAAGPAIVDRLERQFSGVFLFATSGDGRYGIYQRLDAPLATGRDVVCLDRSSCFVEMAEVSEADLRSADSDPSRLGALREVLTSARDTQRRAAAAPPDTRAALVAEWLAEGARVAGCVKQGRC
jgi:hypothetical protein